MVRNNATRLKSKIEAQLAFYDKQRVDGASVLATFGALGLAVGSIGWGVPITGFLIGLVVGFVVGVLAEMMNEH